MSVIRVENLGKAFIAYRSELQRFARWFGFKAKNVDTHWVLKDINFSIAAGEAIGIIGQNGAGKSTLLKMITSTLKPTQGSIHIGGRIAAILELGMGFNPDLSGRQNVFHSAGLMGFTAEQIDAVIQDIEDFAEIGQYFDQPTRVYSSGMQVRVAFAVATAFRPEILIVDEALSVGDAYFQHKSFKKIKEFQELGTTLLIVSHDKSAIQTLCNRAILLNKGGIAKDGAPEEVFDLYNALIAEKEGNTIELSVTDEGKTKTKSGTGEATIKDIRLFNAAGNEADTVFVNEDISVRVDIDVHQDISSLVMGYAIKDRLGQVCYGTNTWYSDQIIQSPTAGQSYQFSIAFPANFGVGNYSVSIALHDDKTHLSENYDWRELALIFDVINSDKVLFQGTAWLDQNIQIEQTTIEQAAINQAERETSSLTSSSPKAADAPIASVDNRQNESLNS